VLGRGSGSAAGGISGRFSALVQQQQQPGASADGVLPQAVMDYVMPPQAVNTDIESQVSPMYEGLTTLTCKQHCRLRHSSGRQHMCC
jgi:hypothetical protein